MEDGSSEDTGTAVCRVAMVGGGSHHIGIRKGIKKSKYLVTLAKFPLISPSLGDLDIYRGCPRIGVGDPPLPKSVQNYSGSYLTPSDGYIGFPYHPLVRPKKRNRMHHQSQRRSYDTQTACAISPKGEGRTHRPRAPPVPKVKQRYTDCVSHRSQRQS